MAEKRQSKGISPIRNDLTQYWVCGTIILFFNKFLHPTYMKDKDLRFYFETLSGERYMVGIGKQFADGWWVSIHTVDETMWSTGCLLNEHVKMKREVKTILHTFASLCKIAKRLNADGTFLEEARRGGWIYEAVVRL